MVVAVPASPAARLLAPHAAGGSCRPARGRLRVDGHRHAGGGGRARWARRRGVRPDGFRLPRAAGRRAHDQGRAPSREPSGSGSTAPATASPSCGPPWAGTARPSTCRGTTTSSSASPSPRCSEALGRQLPRARRLARAALGRRPSSVRRRPPRPRRRGPRGRRRRYPGSRWRAPHTTGWASRPASAAARSRAGGDHPPALPPRRRGQ